MGRTHRPIKDSNVREFGQWITQHQWTEVTTPQDVNEKWNNFHTTLISAYHHFFPLETFYVHPKDEPWITPRIKRLLQQRNRAFATNNLIRYRSLRNKVIRELKQAKKNHYPNKIAHLKDSNISLWFDKIKQLCGLKNHRQFPLHQRTGPNYSCRTNKSPLRLHMSTSAPP